MANRYKYIDTPDERGKPQHLHTLDGKPLIGTSTACKVIAKPLTWWAAGEAVKVLGWTNSKVRVNGKYEAVPYKIRAPIAKKVLARVKWLNVRQYLELLDEAYRAHDTVKLQAADTGTKRHEVLEAWIKRCIELHNGVPTGTAEGLEQFSEWAQKNIKRFLWSEVHGYSEELWTGGIADVGWEDHQGKIVAGDFKSSKDAYFDQFIQIGGYHTMLGENGGHTAEGERVFTLSGTVQQYCVIPFGQTELNPVFLDNVGEFIEGFKSAVHLYKLNQLYFA